MGSRRDEIFTLLTEKKLTFTLPWLDKASFNELLSFVDYVGFNPETNRSLYRLNLGKCAAFPIQDVERALGKWAIKLSDEVKRKVEEFRGAMVINFSLIGSDLVISQPYGSELPDELIEGLPILYDSKSNTYRALPRDFYEVLKAFKDGGYKVNINFNTEFSLDHHLTPSFKLRPYQEKAYEAWRKAGGRGVIVAPVASGKTLLGIAAIADLKVKTLIIVPTIDLLHQWKSSLIKHLGLKDGQVGVFGGGEKDLKPITVITYDSAQLNAERLSSMFGLLIADEAHHAVAESYRRIFELSLAPYELGLTATPFRSDGLHREYRHVLGGVVYEISREELQDEGYLARYVEERKYVYLPEEELKEYRRLMKRYHAYCRYHFPSIKDPRERFEEVLRRASKDPSARDVLRARHKARQIALSAFRKIKVVEELLERFKDKKVLIFSRYTDIITELSRLLLIPKILHTTPRKERKQILQKFRRGEITKLASAMALDEGVDVPDASVGIIISGTGSNREYVQRLGRILRPKEEKAFLLELITSGTIDHALSKRRKRLEVFKDRVKEG